MATTSGEEFDSGLGGRGYISIFQESRNIDDDAMSVMKHLDSREKMLIQREEALLQREKAFEERAQQYNPPEYLPQIDGPSFHPFPKLPLEIRLKIWDLVETPYDEDRIHAIKGIPYHRLKSMKSKPLYHSRTYNEQDPEHMAIQSCGCEEREITYDRVAFVSPHGVHPTLHASREVRQLMLKKHNLTWALDTFVNFERDIIFLDRTVFLEEGIFHDIPERPQATYGCSAANYLEDRPEDLKKITKLAVQVWGEAQDAGETINSIFCLMDNLKEVYFVGKGDRAKSRTGGLAEGRNIAFRHHAPGDDYYDAEWTRDDERWVIQSIIEMAAFRDYDEDYQEYLYKLSADLSMLGLPEFHYCVPYQLDESLSRDTTPAG